MRLPQFTDTIIQNRIEDRYRDSGTDRISFSTGHIKINYYDDCCQVVPIFPGFSGCWVTYPRYEKDGEPRYWYDQARITRSQFNELLINHSDELGEFVLWNQL